MKKMIKVKRIIYSKKKWKKKIVETEDTLREKPQSITTNKKNEKWSEKNKIKYNINISSVLRHILLQSQPFMIVSFIAYMAVKIQKEMLKINKIKSIK